MISVDRRIGSKHLVPLLSSRGHDARLATLEFGDVAFPGLGPPDRAPITVGIEIKTLGDLLGSITSQRFTGRQLPGMLRTYQYPFLLVECDGLRAGAGDSIETRGFRGWTRARTHFRWSSLFGMLTMLQVYCRMPVLWSVGHQCTANMIVRLYSLFSKPWSRHRSHLALPPPPDQHQSPITTTEPSGVRLVAALMPAIGYEWSADVEREFDTVEDMVDAPVALWSAITHTASSGRRIRLGEKRGRRAWEWLRSGDRRVSDRSLKSQVRRSKG